VRLGAGFFTGAVDVAGAVQRAAEQFQSDDGVDDNDEQNKQRNVKQWHQSFQNGIQYDLQACNAKSKQFNAILRRPTTGMRQVSLGVCIC
jgi:hypothetical protein